MSQKYKKRCCAPVRFALFQWVDRDVGDGQVWFSMEEDTGKVWCDTEGKSKKFIKRMLCQMVDDSELVANPKHN